MITNKNILITGGAGFIGSALAKVLIKNNSITGIDFWPNSRASVISKVTYIPTKCSQNEFHMSYSNIDIASQNRKSLNKAMEGQDIVIHCAAIAGIDRTIKNPIDTLETNMFGTYNVLCSAKEVNVEKIIIFSTSEVFGNSYDAQEIDNAKIGSVGQARWTYAISKLAGEHFAYAFYKQYNLPIVIVRPFNVFGPGQIGEGAIHTFIKQALNNETIIINGDGSQIRAWCYIDDMVEAIMRILNFKDFNGYNQDNNLLTTIGQSFNIGNKRNTITILNLAKLIVRLLDSKSEIVHTNSLSADIELRIPNVNKAREILGFEAKVDLETGILKTAEYYKNA